MSKIVHPFAIDGTGFQTSAEVTAALNQQLQALETLQRTYKLPNTTSAIDKFRNQIPGIATVVNTWWLWVDYALSSMSVAPETMNWLLTSLMPVVYWQQQVDKTKPPALRQCYQCAYDRALLTLNCHPFTSTLQQAELENWQAWAAWMVAKFQRTSSQVRRSQRLLVAPSPQWARDSHSQTPDPDHYP